MEEKRRRGGERETDKQEKWQPETNGVSGKANEKGKTEETATEQKEDDKHWRNVRNSPSIAPVYD